MASGSVPQAAGTVDLDRELEAQLVPLNNPEDTQPAWGSPGELMPQVVVWGIPAPLIELMEAGKEGREYYPETKGENNMSSVCVPQH